MEVNRRLVGLLDFKSSAGLKRPGWVRFPHTSANGVGGLLFSVKGGDDRD